MNSFFFSGATLAVTLALGACASPTMVDGDVDADAEVEATGEQLVSAREWREVYPPSSAVNAFERGFKGAAPIAGCTPDGSRAGAVARALEERIPKGQRDVSLAPVKVRRWARTCRSGGACTSWAARGEFAAGALLRRSSISNFLVIDVEEDAGAAPADAAPSVPPSRASTQRAWEIQLGGLRNTDYGAPHYAAGAPLLTVTRACLRASGVKARGTTAQWEEVATTLEADF